MSNLDVVREPGWSRSRLRRWITLESAGCPLDVTSDRARRPAIVHQCALRKFKTRATVPTITVRYRGSNDSIEYRVQRIFRERSVHATRQPVCHRSVQPFGEAALCVVTVPHDRPRESSRARNLDRIRRDRIKSEEHVTVTRNVQLAKGPSVAPLVLGDSNARLRALEEGFHGTVVSKAAYATSNSITDTISTAKPSFVGWWRSAAPKHTHPIQPHEPHEPTLRIRISPMFFSRKTRAFILSHAIASASLPFHR